MRTRIILICVLLLALAGALVLVVGGDGDDDSAPDVVAGFYPLAFAAQELGGPELAVENLTPPGAEPHDIEVSAGQVEELQSAEVVLLLGDGFQPQLEDAADDADGEIVELLETPGLELREGSDAEELPHDPHVWLDPIRYATLVERIADAIERPEAAAPLLRRLHQLDRQYRRGLADCDRREIVTSHEAFGYLADRYGLTEVAILGLSPEAEPTPGELDEVIARVRATDATTVFSESLLPPDLAETVAREADVETAELNPIEGLTEDEHDGGEDYFTLMRDNLAALRVGLGCR